MNCISCYECGTRSINLFCEMLSSILKWLVIDWRLLCDVWMTLIRVGAHLSFIYMRFFSSFVQELVQVSRCFGIWREKLFASCRSLSCVTCPCLYRKRKSFFFFFCWLIKSHKIETFSRRRWKHNGKVFSVFGLFVNRKFGLIIRSFYTSNSMEMIFLEFSVCRSSMGFPLSQRRWFFRERSPPNATV